MSFLAPLYLLGGLAIALPILLHLIRRTPRGHRTFSSLMFLTPSPPRLTRRSRIENWLLLLLRGVTVALIALAFARPFLRASSSLLMDRGVGRQVAVLVDTSASMRRDDLWQQALQAAAEVVDELSPEDDAALYRFDATTELVVDFPDSVVNLEAHRGLLKNELSQLKPSWHVTRLGRALATVAEAMTASDRDRAEEAPGEIVVISDFADGSDLSDLQGYEWPRELTLRAVSVSIASPSNATARLLRGTAETGLRARVTSTAEATDEEFELAWSNQAGDTLTAQTVYVPVGQARVVKLPERPPAADRLRLTGDGADFDQDFFVAPEIQRELRVVYFGDDAADDPSGLRYFLERVWPETPQRKVALEIVPAESAWKSIPGDRPALLVVGTLPAERAAAIREALASGVTGLFVVSDDTMAQAIGELLPGITVTAPEVATVADSDPKPLDRPFALFAEVDFGHPIFTAFAEPRFADFTKIRFWRHTRFEIAEAAQAKVVARFDDGSPAFWQQPVSAGTALVFASSWRPADTALALSSKFVPLMSSVLNLSSGSGDERLSNLTVGDPIRAAEGVAAIVVDPAGVETPLAAGSSYSTSEPGIFTVRSAERTRTVAVNLASAETQTVPMGFDRLEQLGVKMGSGAARVAQAERERQMRDVELESRQKLWQWLIVAALMLLGVETVVAGWSARKQRLTLEPAN